MIREDEIEELKSKLDENGKLIISDDLSDKQKERYEFINSLNIDLIEVLSRNKDDYYVDLGDEGTTGGLNEEDYDDVEVETLDDSSNIEEDDSYSTDDLNNFF